MGVSIINNGYSSANDSFKTISQRNQKVESNESNEKSKKSDEKTKEAVIQSEVQKYKAIEEKVKTHEMAHMSAGGGLAGSVSYQYTTGPDGKRYIVGGEVPITIKTGKTPQETMMLMERVKGAALAPADPSSADRSVAAKAAAIAMQAGQELANSMKDTNKKEKKGISLYA